MRLVKQDRNKVDERWQKNMLFRLLDEFTTGGYDCAMVEGAPQHYASLNSAQTTIAKAAKHFKFFNVRVSIQNGEIYLIKKEL